jgi:hypothetical protein
MKPIFAVVGSYLSIYLSNSIGALIYGAAMAICWLWLLVWVLLYPPFYQKAPNVLFVGAAAVGVTASISRVVASLMGVNTDAAMYGTVPVVVVAFAVGVIGSLLRHRAIEKKFFFSAENLTGLSETQIEIMCRTLLKKSPATKEQIQRWFMEALKIYPKSCALRTAEALSLLRLGELTTLASSVRR